MSNAKDRTMSIKIVEPCDHRPLKDIALEVYRDWARPHYAAKPYLAAMLSLNQIEDMYGADSGTSVVLYFLANAQTWRGETAKRVKLELKAIVAGCDERLATKKTREYYKIDDKREPGL